MSVPPEPIQPRGEAIATADLLRLAIPTQADLDRAIATADPTLRKFIKAKVK